MKMIELVAALLLLSGSALVLLAVWAADHIDAPSQPARVPEPAPLRRAA